MAGTSRKAAASGRAQEPGPPASRPQRRRAGLALPDGLFIAADRWRRVFAQWAAAEVAPGRLVPWLPVAFGFGIVLYFTADREPSWWAACRPRACRHRSLISGAPPPGRIPACARLCRARARLCGRDLADRAHRASGAGVADLERAGHRLRRNPRRARALRPHCRAGEPHRCRPSQHQPGARARGGAQGHGADGRKLRRLQSASRAAASAAAARRL